MKPCRPGNGFSRIVRVDTQVRDALRALAKQLCEEQGIPPTPNNAVRVLLALPVRARKAWEKQHDAKQRDRRTSPALGPMARSAVPGGATAGESPKPCALCGQAPCGCRDRA